MIVSKSTQITSKDMDAVNLFTADALEINARETLVIKCHLTPSTPNTLPVLRMECEECEVEMFFAPYGTDWTINGEIIGFNGFGSNSDL